MKRRKPRTEARIALANLHTTSRPALVLPWLLAICLAHRVDAVLLQECTARHGAWLRRLPRWELVGTRRGDEAILIRRRHASDGFTLRTLTKRWHGRHTGEPHKPRVLPSVVLRTWLRLGSVHFPPGWLDGPQDRQEAGAEYLGALGWLAREEDDLPLFLGGDWNALPGAPELNDWRDRVDLDGAGPRSIDHAAYRDCRALGSKSLGRGPGMDHNARLFVVAEGAR